MVDSDWSALCPTLYDGVGQEDGVVRCGALREVSQKVCIEKVGERMSLLWKMGVKKVEAKRSLTTS